jgi:hypothetical protein
MPSLSIHIFHTRRSSVPDSFHYVYVCVFLLNSVVSHPSHGIEVPCRAAVSCMQVRLCTLTWLVARQGKDFFHSTFSGSKVRVILIEATLNWLPYYNLFILTQVDLVNVVCL